jgi:sulfide:quinone oxidoreductase
MAAASHHNVLIIGGGTAGITVASSLQKRQGTRKLSIAIVEPGDTHYYQPALTLVGAGVCPLTKTRRSEAQLIPGESAGFRTRQQA